MSNLAVAKALRERVHDAVCAQVGRAAARAFSCDKVYERIGRSNTQVFRYPRRYLESSSVLSVFRQVLAGAGGSSSDAL